MSAPNTASLQALQDRIGRRAFLENAGVGVGAAALALIPGGIATLNVLVLMALFGKSQPQRWAFHVLAGLDVLAAIIMAIFWSSIASQVNDIWTLAVPVIGVLVLKAVLTVLVARKLPPPPAA